jgi:hypothetical protein
MLTALVVLAFLLIVVVPVGYVAIKRISSDLALARSLLERSDVVLTRVETLLAEDGDVMHILGGVEAVTGILMGELANLQGGSSPPPRGPRDCG